MTDRTGARLSSTAKSDLLKTMRRVNAAEPAANPAPAPVATYRTPGFDQLPGFDQMRTQRAVADLLGLSNPFYREHEARAGATSVLAGAPVVNFASYDYLGLNGHPEITAAVAASLEQWGTSVSASRITAGERPVHRELEAALAAVYETEDALVFVSGHAAAVSTVATLVGPRDLIIHDVLMHNCVVVGAQLSGAARRVFPHNDLDALDAILAASRANFDKVLIVSEGLFSMDGDGPDLARLIEIKDRYGAWLMMDEAHALGVLGPTGRGIFEAQGVDPARVDLWYGTLSKSLVSCGGYVAGPRTLIEYLKFMAPGMVYSVGMPAHVATAALTALTLMRREPERVAALQANGERMVALARAARFDVGASTGRAVVPLIIGDSFRTVILAERLLMRGFNAFPIIPPGVPEKSARLRLFVSAAHTPAQIEAFVTTAREIFDEIEAEGVSLTSAAKLLRR